MINLKKSEKVKNVTNTYTEEVAEKFGSFTKVLCNRGWARISRKCEALMLKVIEPCIELALPASNDSNTRYGEVILFLHEIISEAKSPRTGFEPDQ